MNKPSPELTARERQALRSFRGALGPSGVQVQGTYAGLVRRLGLPPGADAGRASPSNPSEPATASGDGALAASFSKAALLKTGVSMLAVGGALGFGGGVWWAAPGAAPEPPNTALSREAPPSPERALSAGGAGGEPQGSAQSAPESGADDKPEPEPAPVARTSPKGPRGQESGAQAGASGSPFYEELSYVRRAQSALAAGRPALALGLMATLDEMNLGTALLAEREMTRLLALCALGRRREASAAAVKVEKYAGGSAYAARIAASCAADAALQRGRDE